MDYNTEKLNNFSISDIQIIEDHAILKIRETQTVNPEQYQHWPRIKNCCQEGIGFYMKSIYSQRERNND